MLFVVEKKGELIKPIYNSNFKVNAFIKLSLNKTNTFL